LILQGEVEMISMMAPKGKTEDDDGLLEYLEDIIGSSKYVEDTNMAAQKVEQLTEQRQEKLNRVKAVEKEKKKMNCLLLLELTCSYFLFVPVFHFVLVVEFLLFSVHATRRKRRRRSGGYSNQQQTTSPLQQRGI